LNECARADENFRVGKLSGPAVCANTQQALTPKEVCLLYIGTMPFKVFEQLFRHPLTDQGLESFSIGLETAHTRLGEIGDPA
jgi:hypothetical protein